MAYYYIDIDKVDLENTQKHDKIYDAMVWAEYLAFKGVVDAVNTPVFIADMDGNKLLRLDTEYRRGEFRWEVLCT